VKRLPGRFRDGRAADPNRLAVLVDAGFLLGDMAGYSTRLEAAFRMPFAADRANSFFESARADAAPTTLGPEDHWAIEYAYEPLDPAREAAELQAIAERSRSEPALAFADDLDAGIGNAAAPALAPRVNRFDLGDDPLAYATHRMALTKELWQRVQARGVPPGDDALRLRRSVLQGLRQAARVPDFAAKYVGGMYIERDIQGTGKQAFRPVDPARQCQAMQWLAREILAVDSFRFRPEFLASLTPEYVDGERAPLSVPQIVAHLHGGVLDRLLDAGTARRLLELPLYLKPEEQRGAITLAEVYGSLQGAVWSELKGGREIDPLRRTLQREHLNRVQAMLTRPTPALQARMQRQ